MTRRALLAGVVAGPILACPVLAGPAFAAQDDLEAIFAAASWLNGRPSVSDLKGRVVLLDVFTFECSNCVRVTPNLKRLYRTYLRSNLAIVAVHTPEVPSYQSRVAYLAEQTREAGLPWPIAIDNDYRIWRAYGISAWPTQLVFDREGRLRKTVIGDSQDEDVVSAVKALLGS